MAVKPIQYLLDYVQSHRLERGIRAGLRGIYHGDYTSVREAIAKTVEVSDLIDRADEFNVGSITRPIDTEKLRNGLGLLEQRIDDDYHMGGLPVGDNGL
ncbi:MAG: hypothetical protein QF824_04590 [Candidatus Woesearchaeota archaeon]|jgi:hypothetical protein|nr:hypothetical protein [Candidatus Woesearchaeota archaeon]